MSGRNILLVIGGGISAFKSLEVIRRLKSRGDAVRVVLTEAGRRFVTELSVTALSGEPVFTNMFDVDGEVKFGHIRLSRESDLIVAAPATADLMAKMAAGLGSDLASALMLATDKKVLLAPAMNVRMWNHPATQRNIRRLKEDGLLFVGPNEGAMACGEFGPGRMAEPDEIVAAIDAALPPRGPLTGKKVLVTAGPTHEAIDPVRYIANRSSGKQGYAIAAALAALGAETTLISGPTRLAPPQGVDVVSVESARDMQAAVEAALPVDAAVFAAAVADWRPTQTPDQKIKKTGADPAPIELLENPDILAGVAHAPAAKRPALVVGFAAETESVLENAAAKRAKKGCDWIVANDVSAGVFEADENRVHLVTAEGVETWPLSAKTEIAARLAEKIAHALEKL